MELIIKPGMPLQGSLILPGDKSLSHRAALFAALADGQSVIDNFLVAGVTQVMLGAISAVGVSWELRGSRLIIQGTGLSGLRPPLAPIQCGSSATTIRLLAGALAASGIPAVLDGSPGLRRRPMKRIVQPLHRMGVPIQASDGGFAPLRLAARLSSQFLHALDYTLPVASAQVKTCLLLAALAADGPCTLTEPEISRDHSERMLAAMGVDIQVRCTRVTLNPPGSNRLKPLHLVLPGDISSAAFLIVAALITPGSQITLRDVLLNPTRTGLLDALKAMGANIQIDVRSDLGGEPAGDVSARFSILNGIEIDGTLAVRMIDEFPVFAIAAAFARGQTVVRGAAELRHKESDRILALCAELRQLGIDLDETSDGFRILGGKPVRGGTARAHGDHRLAMALAVAGLASETLVSIQDAEIVAESFPGFVDTLRTLGANLRQES